MKNGTLKAMLQSHKHQGGLMEEQDNIFEGLSAENAASKKRNTLLIQQGQRGGMESQPPSRSRTANVHAYLPSNTVSTLPFNFSKRYIHSQEKC